MKDISQQLTEALKTAFDSESSLKIVAGNTKHFMGRQTTTDQVLNIGEHSGIVAYEPIELIMTVLSGTKLTEISAALAEHNQMLSFEPPNFDGQATIGGTLAANLSGPARPWSGSIRDMVLGVNLINGCGELLSFGGQVMKNVAGYDVSRMQAGAMGVLGVMTQISLKVMPRPELETTLCLPVNEADAIILMNKLTATPKPITAASWYKGELHVRLSGSSNSVVQCVKEWLNVHGFVEVVEGQAFWQTLREYQHDFFEGSQPIWRYSIKPTVGPLNLSGDSLLDWSGAQRWVKGDFEMQQMHSLAVAANGSVSKWRGGERSAEVNSAMPMAMQELQQRLKRSLDPKNILNPGRIYSWL